MADLFRLDGKVATVTGGTDGIGEVIAHGLARYGANLIQTEKKNETCPRRY